MANKPILVIDAGHGGTEYGGGTCDLFTEKDMNLQVSLYQAKRCEELGIPYIITRTDDTTLNATPRATMVRESGAKVCISNHCNSGGGHGVDVIYSIHNTSRFALLVLGQLQNEGAAKHGAGVWTKESTKSPGFDYYFMHRNTGPVETLIVEYGYADNETDKQLIASFWKKYAEAVLRGVCLYLELPYVAPGTQINSDQNIGINYLYDAGLLLDKSWSKTPNQPLPLWALGLVLQRFEKRIQKD